MLLLLVRKLSFFLQGLKQLHKGMVRFLRGILVIVGILITVLVIEVLFKLSKVLDSIQAFFNELSENDESLAEIVSEIHETRKQ